MYKITSEQLKWAFESPACRHVYVAGDSYCAVGKFCAMVLGQNTFRSNIEFIGEFVRASGPAEQLLLSIETSMGKKWTKYTDMNDSYDGSLQDNHRKALRALLQDALAAGFIELEDDVAKEFYYTLQGTTLNEMA